MMRTSARAARRFAGLVVCGVLAAGCQAHLYNQENDKQAALLKEKISAVKVEEPIKAARENHKAISEALTASLDRRYSAGAKANLIKVIADGDSIETGLAKTISEDLRKSIGASEAKDDFQQSIIEALHSYGMSSAYAQEVTHLTNVLMRNGAVTPRLCAAKLGTNDLPERDKDGKPKPDLPTADDYIENVPQDEKSATEKIKRAYESYVSRCAELLAERDDVETELEKSPSSLTSLALKAWRSSQAKFLAERRRGEAKLKEYRKLEVEYKAALKERAGRPVDADKKIDELFKKAADALDLLSKVSDHGVELASEERIAKLQGIISLLSGGKETDEKSSGSVSKLSEATRQQILALAKLPGLVDEINKLLNAAETARLAPLRFELSYQKQVLAGAQRNIDLMQEDVAIDRDLYLNRLKHAERLLEARRNLGIEINTAARGAPEKRTKIVDQKKTIHDILSAVDTLSKAKPEQRYVINALIAYYEAEARYDGPLNRARFDHTSRAYQRNLDADEMALAEWKVLIEGESAILADYHSAGVKPESLGGLISAIMLAFIAYGVN